MQQAHNQHRALEENVEEAEDYITRNKQKNNMSERWNTEHLEKAEHDGAFRLCESPKTCVGALPSPKSPHRTNGTTELRPFQLAYGTNARNSRSERMTRSPRRNDASRNTGGFSMQRSVSSSSSSSIVNFKNLLWKLWASLSLHEKKKSGRVDFFSLQSHAVMTTLLRYSSVNLDEDVVLRVPKTSILYCEPFF